MNVWNNQEDLEIEDEMMYESKSLFATARPNNWPIMFKAGVVDADYKILEETLTQNFRELSGTGYAYGIALVLGGDTLRLELLDYKRVKIGNDAFDSIGISLGILFGPGGFK